MDPVEFVVHIGAEPLQLITLISNWLAARGLTPETCTVLVTVAVCGDGIWGLSRVSWPAMLTQYRRLAAFFRRFAREALCVVGIGGEKCW